MSQVSVFAWCRLTLSNLTTYQSGFPCLVTPALTQYLLVRRPRELYSHAHFHHRMPPIVTTPATLNVPIRLSQPWGDGKGFLAKRYGLANASDIPSEKKPLWNKKIGLKPARPLQAIVEFYESVVNKNSWPPTCDLSPEATPNVFPSPSPGNVLALTKTELGYVVAIQDGVTRPWKLLISDPLTILQIEREAWCSDGRNLILNLVLSGLPFELLLNNCIRDKPFRPHRGPVIHPDGHDPRLADYYSYRHNLAYFLSEYPHARAAALCAGGILWRLAMDTHEFKSEAEIVGPFHASSCISRLIGGERYWTPSLSTKEEATIVGVHRWAVGKLNDSVVFMTAH